MFHAIRVGHSRCRVAKSNLYGQALVFGDLPASSQLAPSPLLQQHEVGGLEPLRIAHDVHEDCFDLASQLQIVQLHLIEVYKILFTHLRDCKQSCHRIEVSPLT